MKYEFIAAEKTTFQVNVMCRVFGVKESGFYAWCRRGESERTKADRALTETITDIFESQRCKAGAPRVHLALQQQGHHVGRKRVARLMRAQGLTPRRRRRYVVTTDSSHQERVAPNLLQRNFATNAPNRVWVSDITYIPTASGWLYLCVVLDLFSRRVVGWSMGDGMPAELVQDALRMAIRNRRPPRGVIFHSDRGVQYTARCVRRSLKAIGARQSMSRKGDCWDNAVAESFFGSLKQELVHHCRFSSQRHATAELREYIEVFYNCIRIHTTNAGWPPAKYERLKLRACAA
jgi:transposase InsO family protein